MRQAIVTKFLGPTNSRGSRVKAVCEAGQVALAWDDALDMTENHEAAAKALCDRLGWEWEHFKGGGLPRCNSHAYCYVDTRGGTR